MNEMIEPGSQGGHKNAGQPGPKYHLDIEGTQHEWGAPTITTEQIAQLGGWDISQGVVLIDADNVERTLTPGEVVELKPGQGFSKKVRFKRGATGAHCHG